MKSIRHIISLFKRHTWTDWLGAVCATPSIILDEFVSMFRRIELDEVEALNGSEIDDDPDA